MESAENYSDLESATDSEFDGFDNPETTTFPHLLSTKDDESSQVKKRNNHALKSDAEKLAKLSDKIFDYIHAAYC